MTSVSPPPAGSGPSAALSATARRILDGSVRDGARLMRGLDDHDPAATDLLAELYPHTGRAQLVGITGVPGAGKSTLVSQLIGGYRRRGLRVGVVAIDPTSPFTGGAILGDRVRMQHHATDPGVFIRSMATRGHLGGLSRSTSSVVNVLDAMGYDVILIETVGVGQDEVEVVRLAHTCVVVVVPGLGDEVQNIKAGIMEIADVFCVNKADRPDSGRLVTQLRSLLRLSGGGAWSPSIVRTVASENRGIDDLLDAIDAHGAREGGDAARAARDLERIAAEIEAGVLALAQREVQALLTASPELIARATSRASAPDAIARDLWTRIVGPSSDTT